jgi:hypothetical protein
MNTETKSKAKLQQRVQSLISGTQKHTPTGSLTFGGSSYDVASLVQILQGLGNAIAASDAAKAKWNDATTAMRAQRATVGSVIRAYQSYLFATLGNAPSTLADYGLAPHKTRAPLTGVQLAAATAKAHATRAARGTMGSVQKKGIKGNVDGVVVTPIVKPQPVATPPVTTPAPAASPSGSTPHTS